MLPEEADRLAVAVHALRPDWPARSLRTFINNQMMAESYHDGALALVWVAIDPRTTTPARALQAGPWRQAGLADRATEQPPSSRDPFVCSVCHHSEAACRRLAAMTDDPHPFTPTTGRE